MSGSGDLRSFVAANSRKARARLGITQQEAAELIDVTPRYYRDIEAGRVNLTLETLQRLATRLQVPAHQLLRPTRLVKQRPGRPKGS
jgi:transcriptional regulator with XRE-family HTH domain